MRLERVEIVGFRGINRLSLMLEHNNVLLVSPRRYSRP